MTTALTPTESQQSLKQFHVNASAVVIMTLDVDAASVEEANEIAKQAYDHWQDANSGWDVRSDAMMAEEHLSRVTNLFSEVVHFDIDNPTEQT